MPLPQHVSPNDDRRARAPYNFIPLPEGIIRYDQGIPPERNLPPNHDMYYADRKTGYIQCRLTTQSPLYIRCALTRSLFDLDEQEKDRNGQRLSPSTRMEDRIKNTPEFFYTRTHDQPVIPGSSLRGMLRGLTEIVTWSKLQVVSETNLFFRALADSNANLRNIYRGLQGQVKAGFVEQVGTEFYVKPVTPIGGQTYFKVREATMSVAGLSFISLTASTSYVPQYLACSFDLPTGPLISAVGLSGSLANEGVIVCSGPMQGKVNHWVVPTATSGRHLIPPKVVEEYRDGITEFQKQDPPFNKRNGCLVNGRPIFFVEESGSIAAIGHTPYFRFPYRLGAGAADASPKAFTPESLRQESDTDLAEAIFGYTKKMGEGKKRAYASRVFITDAALDPGVQENIWLSTTFIPKILASPKPTTFQHYLVQDAAKGHDPNTPRELAHYATPTPDETVIRGHKLYWHKGNVTKQQIEVEGGSATVSPTNTQHTQFKPVASGKTFSLRIYFENLSPVELGALLWVLTPRGFDDKEYRHSIGMGKPLGMGVVKIEPALHISHRTTRYAALFKESGWETGDEPDGTDYIGEFERYMLPAERELRYTCLREVPRIKMLLKMLEWNETDPENAMKEYMELGEFSARKVLPDPLHLNCAGQPTEPDVVLGPDPAQLRGAFRVGDRIDNGSVEFVKGNKIYIRIRNQEQLVEIKHQGHGKNQGEIVSILVITLNEEGAVVEAQLVV